MPLKAYGVAECNQCGKAVEVMWPTQNCPLNAVLPKNTRDSLRGWRFGYSRNDWGSRLIGDAEFYCPDHAESAPAGAQVHA